MTHKQNLHCHTTFCDGANTPREMAEEAIRRGFDSLGFSIHSYVPCSGASTLEGIAAYQQELPRLKEEYRDRIQLYMGMEYDIFSAHGYEGYDYTIASVHCLQCPEGIVDFDKKLEPTLAVIQRHFGGDAMAFARCYYETVATIPQYGSFDILGHLDLITKNNEMGGFLDVQDPRYLSWAKEAIHALKGKIPLFEVNTGCIGRGYRSTPYPQPELLKELKACGFGAIISSDCHNKEQLDCNFAEAAQLLEAAGFRSIYVLEPAGFREIPLSI